MNNKKTTGKGMTKDIELNRKVDRILEFIFCLYDLKYEQGKSFNSQIRGLLTRAFSTDNVPRESRRAMTLSRQISASFALYGSLPLTWEDVGKLKDILQKFASDVKKLLITIPNNYCLAVRAFQFGKQWNQLVRVLESQFLEGFGDIFASELCIISRDAMLVFLSKLRKAKCIPRELSVLHNKRNQVAITKSIEAHIAFQKMIANK